MKLYVYCLAEGIDALAEPLPGISGVPVRLIKIEDLAVLVSDLDADTIQVTRENALNHASVVRSVLDRTTPLPFRFGTLINEQQLRSYISTRKPALETRLASVRGCVEMSVKIIMDSSDADEPEHTEHREIGDGTKFLSEKRREIIGTQRRSAHAEEISKWLQARVSGLTKDEQLTVPSAERLFLAAAHLVERANLSEYREKLAEARASRPELHFLLSGPWPPYSFTNIELEFETQFGVS